MQWYYAKENKQLGPVDEMEFQRLIDTDQITPNDLVWNSAMKDWTPAASVAGLFPDYIAPPTTPVTYSLEHTTTDFSMLTHNRDLLQRAKASLQNNWGSAIGIFLLYFIISYAIGSIPLIGNVAPFIISGPFSLGLCLFFLSLVRKSETKINQLFDGFKTFEISMVTYMLMLIFTLLWMLLLIIPGIIAAISYSMTYYIIIDNPNISPLEAITKSKEIMQGNKMKFFYMQCRFFGWILLAMTPPLTLSLITLRNVETMNIASSLLFAISWGGFIWLYPYMMTAKTEFYEDIRKAQKDETNDSTK